MCRRCMTVSIRLSLSPLCCTVHSVVFYTKKFYCFNETVRSVWTLNVLVVIHFEMFKLFSDNSDGQLHRAYAVFGVFGTTKMRQAVRLLSQWSITAYTSFNGFLVCLSSLPYVLPPVLFVCGFSTSLVPFESGSPLCGHFCFGDNNFTLWAVLTFYFGHFDSLFASDDENIVCSRTMLKEPWSMLTSIFHTSKYYIVWFGVGNLHRSTGVYRLWFRFLYRHAEPLLFVARLFAFKRSCVLCGSNHPIFLVNEYKRQTNVDK